LAANHQQGIAEGAMANLPSWKDLEAEFQRHMEAHHDLFAELHDYKGEWVLLPITSPRAIRLFVDIAGRAARKLDLQPGDTARELWQRWIIHVKKDWPGVPRGDRSQDAKKERTPFEPWHIKRRRLERMERTLTNVFQTSAAFCGYLAERDEYDTAPSGLQIGSEPPKQSSIDGAPEAAPTKKKRLPSTVTSQIAARRMEGYLTSKGIGQTEFAVRVGTSDRTLRSFRSSGKVRRKIFDDIAKAMGITREALLDPEGSQ
jgi:hypothetical protein